MKKIIFLLVFLAAGWIIWELWTAKVSVDNTAEEDIKTVTEPEITVPPALAQRKTERPVQPVAELRPPAYLPDYGKFSAVLAKLCEKHPWLAAQRDEILANADKWMKKTDDEIWFSVPYAGIPRFTVVNRLKGCPICGPVIHTGYGYYPWLVDMVNKPWKVQCPKCKEWFPKNDFLKYYLSGINGRGIFDPTQADQKLLFNENYPNPKDPRHKLYVDAGDGYRDANGDIFWFVGCYNHAAYSGRRPYPGNRLSLTTAALDLAYAYLFTGDVKYALKAAVILSRIATFYPAMDNLAMDYRCWANQTRPTGVYTRDPGKILDFIWENMVIAKILQTYGIIAPAVKDHPQLQAFLAGKKNHIPFAGEARIQNIFIDNMEYNYLKEIFENVKIGNIRGNIGMFEKSMALAALVTYDEKFRADVVRWLFTPAKMDNFNTYNHVTRGGGLAELVFGLTRDGFSWESGGYCNIRPEELTAIYQILSRSDWIPKSETMDAIINLYKMRLGAYFRNRWEIIALQRFQPYWGDNGGFANPYYKTGIDPTFLLNGFMILGDPQTGAAAMAVAGNDKLRGNYQLNWHDLFFIDQDFEKKLNQLAALPPAPPSAASVNLAGRGLALLKSGTGEFARCLWTHYGNNHDCHNHRDTLNLGLFAFGRDILPGLGYPDLTQKNENWNWHHSAICNNLVVVNRQDPLRKMQIADQKFFAESDLAVVGDIDAHAVYPELARYRRLFALINISKEDFYVMDFFEVQGGDEHVASFHSGEGEVTVEPRLKFRKQARGTYAGEDVNFGDKVEYTGKSDVMHRYGNGLSFLYDVERASDAESAAFTWQLKDTHAVCPYGDTIRCRLNLLTPVKEIALAKGKPPQNSKGNPEFITYVLAKNDGRSGEAISDFASVIECYREGSRPIKEVRKLKKLAGDEFAVAVKILFQNGKSDLIIKLRDLDAKAVFEGGISMQGRFAVLRLDEKNRVESWMAAMTREISFGSFHKTFMPCITSKVRDFDKGVSAQSWIEIDGREEIPANALRPLWTDIAPTHKEIDGNYRILGFSATNNNTRLDIGPGSFIVDKKYDNIFDAKSLDGAFIYAFEKGSKITIPLSYYGIERENGPPHETSAKSAEPR